MNKSKIPKFLFWTSLVCMLLTSLSFLIMPLASTKALEGEKWWQVLAGTIFWVPLIIGYTLLFLTNRWRRRRTEPKSPPGGIKNWGAFKIASNFYALLADGICMLSIIGFLIFYFINSENYGTYIFLCLTVFAFQMHCTLNGVNYKHYVSKSYFNRRKQEGK